MKKLGIIGGIGWPSTVEYYRLICRASLLYPANRKFSGPPPTPEMVIESLNMNYSVNNRGTSDGSSWMIWDAYFNQAMQRLVRAGAELIIIASVTPHSRLKEISENINIPVLSIYDAIGEYCTGAGIRKLLVLGTMPTMSSPAFTENLHRFNVKAVYPTDETLKAKGVNHIYSPPLRFLVKLISSRGISWERRRLACINNAPAKLAYFRQFDEVNFAGATVTHFDDAVGRFFRDAIASNAGGPPALPGGTEGMSF